MTYLEISTPLQHYWLYLCSYGGYGSSNRLRWLDNDIYFTCCILYIIVENDKRDI